MRVDQYINALETAIIVLGGVAVAVALAGGILTLFWYSMKKSGDA